MDRTYSEYSLEDIPRILLELLVTEAETTVLLVDIENDNINVSTNLSELAGMLDLLGPREIRDMDEAVDTLLKLCKDAEAGEVANNCSVL